MTGEPDVSVVVPVYNAMPYLTECLMSLVGQSIGAERMQVVAVDDGSTDGSDKELERFAQLHPGLFTVARQDNSGGPAAPCNAALELATGRYVYFLGADDYLGEQALEKLVVEADTHGSDVVAGRMVGVNGRYVHQAIYRQTDHDVDLFRSDLPWSMSNAKLFRRSMVEEHGLRFDESMPVNSDQPFTLEACLRARRISVLADDVYYYAVRRGDTGNITYNTRPLVNLACARKTMERAVALLPAGPDRDAILRRLFAWELVKVLSVGFLDLDEDTQGRLCHGVGELADRFLTDGIRRGLVVRRRVLVCLAQAGEPDLLRDTVRRQKLPGGPAVHAEEGRVYVTYPGFRSGRVPDDVYEVGPGGEDVDRRLAETAQVVSLRPTGRLRRADLAVAVHLGLTGPDADGVALVAITAVRIGGPTTTSGGQTVDVTGARPAAITRGGEDLTVRCDVDLAPLLGRRARGWRFVLRLDVAGRLVELPLPAGTVPRSRVVRHGRRPVRLTWGATRHGNLRLEVAPIAGRRLLRAGPARRALRRFWRK